MIKQALKRRSNILRSSTALTRPAALVSAIAALALGSGSAFAVDADTLPTGGKVVGGAATITQSNARMDINQTSNRTVIDWRSFDIGEDAHVNFDQPTSNSIAVNRVNASTNASQINGGLTANGQVWILNANGVMFGKNAQIDVAGLVASTAHMDRDRFMAGDTRLEFSKGGTGSVVNEGQISIREGGLAAFVAPAVRNNGVITAKLGRVALASGDTFTLDLAGDRLVEIGLGSDMATTEQFGQVLAEGGVIEISAKAAGDVVDSLVNLDGITSAASAEVVGGKIILGGDNVQIAGTVDASGATGGGSIEIDGDRITTTASADIRSDGLDTGDGGVVIAYANISGQYDGSFSATGGANGGDGGFVETSGKQVDISQDISVNTSAAHGKTGTWSIDPDDLTVVESGGDGDSTINAGTIVSNLETTNVELKANDSITVDAEIDSSSQTNSNNLDLADEDQDGVLEINLNAKILLGSNQTLTGDGSQVNVASSGSIQNGIDVAASGATVDVAAGTYEEVVTIGKAVTLEGAQAGVDARTRIGDEAIVDGSVILTSGGTGTTIDGFTILDGAFDGGEKAGIFIKRNATDITVQNTIFTRSGDVDGDGYRGVVTFSGGNQTGLVFQNNSFSGWATGIYLNQTATGAQILNNNFTGNFVGVSDDGPDGSVITGNLFANNLFEGLGLGPDDVDLSSTISDNIFLNNDVNIGFYLGSDTEIDVSDNVFDNVDASTASIDELLVIAEKIKDGTNSADGYSGHASLRDGYVFVTEGGSINDGISIASFNDTVAVGAGTYVEAVTVDKTLTFNGAEAGVDARGRSADEAIVNGGFIVTSAADGTVIDGFEIVDGLSSGGSKAGVAIQRNATDITVQNTIFSRSGDVDSDGYRGIVNFSNGGHTGLLVQNNSFSGWATGVYLNPGAIGAQILDNDFDGNFVGVSVDNPGDTVITGNLFANNLFEGLGVGDGDILSMTVDDNIFTDNTVDVSLYADMEVDLTSNSFDGVLASDMTTQQLVALEDKINHGLDEGFTGYAVTREGNVYVTEDSGSIQRAHDTIGAGSSLTNQNVINVAPGDYTEGNAGVRQDGSDGGTQNFGLHLYNDYVLVQGLDSSGAVIADAAATAATVTAAYQTGFGAQHFVYGDGVSVTGLNFKPVDGGSSKTFEVIGDHFTLKNSVIDNSSSTTAINLYLSEFADQGKDAETFTIEDNIFLGSDTPYYMITFASGTGDDTNKSNRVFSGNIITGGNAETQTGIRFNGIVPGIPWLIYNVDGVTIENNTFSDLNTYVSSRGADLPDLGFADIFDSNTFEDGAVITYAGSTETVRTVDVSVSGASEDVPYAAITRTIDDSLAIAQAGDTVVMSEGTFVLDSTLNINKSVAFQGQGEDGTIIDASDITGYGMHVSVDDVILSDFTMYGPSADSSSNYGIKVSPGTGTQLSNFSISDVIIQGSGRAELDLNGVSGATITNVTAHGHLVSDGTTETGGAGIQITDSEDVTLTGVTTLGNAWGGVALYQTNVHFDLQVNNINIDASENSFNEANGLYTEDESAGLDFGTVNLSGFTHTVRNENFRTDGDEFTFYQIEEQTAIDFALGLESDTSSYIEGWSGTSDTGVFTVGIGTDGSAMTIMAAVNAASDDNVINVRAGTYDQSLVFDSGFAANGLTISGDDTSRSNITGGVRTLQTSDIDGLTFENLVITGIAENGNMVFDMDNTGVVSDLALDNVVIDGESVSGRHGFGGQNLAGDFSITNSTFQNILGWSLMDMDPGNGEISNRQVVTSITFSGNTVKDSNGNVLLRGNADTPTETVIVENNSFSNIGGNSGETGDHRNGLSINNALSVTVEDNSFSEIDLGNFGTGHALLLGEGITSTSITGNDFSDNQMNFGLESSTEVDLRGNSFDGVEASGMSNSELLAVAATIDDGTNSAGGYSGLALLKEDHVFVTEGRSILAGVGLAASGDTVVADSGTFDEDVADNKKVAFSFNDTIVNGLTLNTTGSSLSGSVTADTNGFEFTADVILEGDVTLTDTADAGVITAAIDGTSAGGQSLNIVSGGSVELGSLGSTTRLGVTTIDGGTISLNGAAYKANSLEFNGPVTVTQDLTVFETTQSDTAAGDITFTGDIFGTDDAGQSISFIAGDGAGEASSNGYVSLQNAGTETLELDALTVAANEFSAATVYLSGNFTSIQTGDLTFTDETLNAGGDVSTDVGGNIAGPINSGSNVVMVATGDIVSNVGGNNVSITSKTGKVDSTVQAVQAAKVSANTAATVNVTAGGGVDISSTTSTVDATVASNDTVSIIGNSAVVASVTSGTAVQVGSTTSNVTANVKATGDVTVTAGQDVAGDISGKNVGVTGIGITSNVTADNEANLSGQTVVSNVVATTAIVKGAEKVSGSVVANNAEIETSVVDVDVATENLTLKVDTGNVEGDIGNLETDGGVVGINGQTVVGESDANDMQLIVAGYVLPEGAIVDEESGTITLPGFQKIGAISPVGGTAQPKVIIVNNVQTLGALLEEGYQIIIIDLESDSTITVSELIED